MVTEHYSWLAIDHDSKAYWEGCLQQKLMINRCQDCGYWIHFPRPICPKCWSENVRPAEVRGRGTIYTFSVHHQTDDPQPEFPLPHAVALSELD